MKTFLFSSIFILSMTTGVACDWCTTVEGKDQAAVAGSQVSSASVHETIVASTIPVCAVCHRSITDERAGKLSCPCKALYHTACAYELVKSFKAECPACEHKQVQVHEVGLTIAEQNQVDKQVEHNFKCYYLDVMYPSMAFLRHKLFPCMCPRAIGVVINNILLTLRHDPYSYFTGRIKKKSLLTADIILQELVILTEYVHSAKVWTATQKVFEFDQRRYGQLMLAPGKPARQNADYVTLFAWWKKAGIGAVEPLFYAVCLDYLITQFYCYALRPYIDETFERYAQCLPQIEATVKCIIGTQYEAYYKEALNTVRRIKNILDRRLEEHRRRLASLNGKGPRGES